MDSLPPEIILEIFTQASTTLSIPEFFTLISLNKILYTTFQSSPQQLSEQVLTVLSRAWGCGNRCLQTLSLAMQLEPLQDAHRWKHVKRVEVSNDAWRQMFKNGSRRPLGGSLAEYEESCPGSCIDDSPFTDLLERVNSGPLKLDWLQALDIYIKSRSILTVLRVNWETPHPRNHARFRPDLKAENSNCLLCDWFASRAVRFLSKESSRALEAWFGMPPRRSEMQLGGPYFYGFSDQPQLGYMVELVQNTVRIEKPPKTPEFPLVDEQRDSSKFETVGALLIMSGVQAIWEFVCEAEYSEACVIQWSLGHMLPRTSFWCDECLYMGHGWYGSY